MSPTLSNDTTSHAAKLAPSVYERLRGLARRRLRGRRRDGDRQATELVHETYLRVCRTFNGTWNDDTHFFNVAARQMRFLLIERIRAANTLKRGDGIIPLPLTDDIAAEPRDPLLIAVIDQALDRLAREQPRPARVVELRVLGGLTVRETAYVLGVSERTVKHDWRAARVTLTKVLE